MNLRHCFAIAAACMAIGTAHTKEAAPLADDPVAEKRLLEISAELRCLVCQNESLAGSRADLANDLRREIRDMIHAGKSDAEIMEFLVARYGDFVSYRPPVKPITWLLWGGPFLLLFIGIGLLINFLRQRTHTVTSTELSAQEQQRAQQLIDELSSSKKSDPTP
jgi:cytochrome c-type biogenesis protein CcmH